MKFILDWFLSIPFVRNSIIERLSRYDVFVFNREAAYVIDYRDAFRYIAVDALRKHPNEELIKKKIAVLQRVPLSELRKEAANLYDNPDVDFNKLPATVQSFYIEWAITEKCR